MAITHEVAMAVPTRRDQVQIEEGQTIPQYLEARALEALESGGGTVVSGTLTYTDNKVEIGGTPVTVRVFNAEVVDA